jgi:hypothetical protein
MRDAILWFERLLAENPDLPPEKDYSQMAMLEGEKHIYTTPRCSVSSLVSSFTLKSEPVPVDGDRPMPITVTWEDAAQTILRLDFLLPWTWEEFDP